MFAAYLSKAETSKKHTSSFHLTRFSNIFFSETIVTIDLIKVSTDSFLAVEGHNWKLPLDVSIIFVMMTWWAEVSEKIICWCLFSVLKHIFLETAVWTSLYKLDFTGGVRIFHSSIFFASIRKMIRRCYWEVW